MTPVPMLGAAGVMGPALRARTRVIKGEAAKPKVPENRKFLGGRGGGFWIGVPSVPEGCPGCRRERSGARPGKDALHR
jgi:hypothetical protein